MLSSRISLFNKIGIISLILMSYSGYIKWLPSFYIDPFIIFSIILLLIISINYFRNNLNKDILNITLYLLIFFVFCCISTSWGASKVYYLEKVQKFLIIIFCFITPFFMLRNRKNLSYFINAFLFFGFIVALTIIAVYLVLGNLFLLTNQDLNNEIKNIPDYLALGTLLSCCFILTLNKKNNFFWISYKIILLISIILLAPRGPIITLAIVFILYSLARYNFGFLIRKFFLITIVGLLINLTLIGFTDRLFSRFTNILDKESTSYSSIDSRFDLASNAWNYFISSPILGIGFGSFGTKYAGFEDRIEPHNIFLEIISETGLIGFLLFLFFIILILLYLYKNANRRNELNIILILVTIYLFVQSLISTYLIDSKDLFLWLGITLSYYSTKSYNLNDTIK